MIEKCNCDQSLGLINEMKTLIELINEENIIECEFNEYFKGDVRECCNGQVNERDILEKHMKEVFFDIGVCIVNDSAKSSELEQVRKTYRKKVRSCIEDYIYNLMGTYKHISDS